MKKRDYLKKKKKQKLKNRVYNKKKYIVKPAYSAGEEEIARFLDKWEIKYKREKQFKWLLSDINYPLRLDFYLPDYHKAIEFDGIYHYKKGNNRQKQNDKRKNDLCNIHGLPLLRIPYWDFDKIEKTLKGFLKV